MRRALRRDIFSNVVPAKDREPVFRHIPVFGDVGLGVHHRRVVLEETAINHLREDDASARLALDRHKEMALSPIPDSENQTYRVTRSHVPIVFVALTRGQNSQDH